MGFCQSGNVGTQKFTEEVLPSPAFQQKFNEVFIHAISARGGGVGATYLLTMVSVNTVGYFERFLGNIMLKSI